MQTQWFLGRVEIVFLLLLGWIKRLFNAVAPTDHIREVPANTVIKTVLFMMGLRRVHEGVKDANERRAKKAEERHEQHIMAVHQQMEAEWVAAVRDQQRQQHIAIRSARKKAAVHHEAAIARLIQ